MIKVIRSYRRGKHFWQEVAPISFTDEVINGHKMIVIQSDKTYQTHFGFGGAFTEAAAVTFYEANKNQQEEMLNAYFSDKGLKYNLGRTAIHSTDFSEVTRTYVKENDQTLETFNITEDERVIIPLIKAALDKRKLWLFASPWSPPAYMKINQDIYYGGKLKDAYYPLWATYFVKYIQAMKQYNIEIEAVTLQNEPEAIQVWESCYYSATDELKLAKHLLQKLEENKLDIKLIIWDHNRDVMVERAHTILRELKDKIWGVGYHWYVREDSENLSMIHDLYPNQHLLFTEGCVEFTNTAQNSLAGGKDKWSNAEYYGRNIIRDALNYSEGFVDWNLYLNEIGGPNHVGNYCEAPIMYDRITKTVMFNPSYYYIGHFSRYIDVGAKRIHSNHTVDKELHVVAYKNLDNSIVVVVQNEGWVKEIAMIIDGKHVQISLPEHSITTYIIA